MNHPRAVRSVLFGFLVLALAAVAGAQTTWHVDVHGTPPGTGTQADPYTSIQYAISRPSTVNYDTVLVAPGEYVESVSTMNKRIKVRASGGPLVTTIRPAQLPSHVVRMFGDPTELEGFTIAGGVHGVHVVSGMATIRRCIVRDNTNTGIFSDYDAFVEECTITGNLVGVRATNFGNTAILRNTLVTFNATNILADNGSGGVSTGHCLVGIADPGFWDYDQRDLRLRPGSPAIDAGDPTSPKDPDGSIIDIGALTYDPTYAPPPTKYCTGKLNSQDCTPKIGAVGTASATSTGPFTITASDLVDHKSGLMIFGFGPRAQPFQGGLHCVTLPTKRVGVQSSGGGDPCTGTFAFDMRAYIQSGVHRGLVPGEKVYCQWWSRDPQDPAGWGTSLTDALSFGIAP